MRAILADNESVRTSVVDLVKVFDQINHEDLRGFQLASILNPESPTFTPRSKPVMGILEDMYHVLLCDHLDRSMEVQRMPKQALFFTELSQHGVCYATLTSSMFKDSSIIFQDCDNLERVKAGIINHIFQYRYPKENREIVQAFFFIVQEFIQIDGNEDIYADFPFGGFLAKPSNRETIISLPQLRSHSALTKFVEGQFTGLVHVLPLDQVSWLYS